MIRPKYSTTLVCGFAAGVLSIVPGIKSFTCCLLVPFATGVALFLDQKINGKYEISKSQAVLFGIATGISAAFFNSAFDLLLTYFTRTNEFITMLPEVEKMYRSLPLPTEVSGQAIRILRGIESEIALKGFSLFYAVFLIVNGILSNLIFGMLGGIIASSYLNKKMQEQ